MSDDAAARHERARSREERRRQGVYYTPEPLVAHLLDTALEPALDDLLAGLAPDEAHQRLLTVRVCDPTCGAGRVLLGAAHRLAARLTALRGTGGDDARRAALAEVAGCLHGADVDPDALAVLRASLAELAGPAAAEATHLAHADALLDPDALVGGYHVVVGNPPFLTPLAARSALTREDAARVRCWAGEALAPYTDISALFVLRGLDLLAPGGRLALVQPQSVLAARDAAGVRAAVTSRAAVTDFWASDQAVFEDARVRACVLTLHRDAVQGRVRHHPGEETTPLPEGEWGALLAPSLGMPRVSARVAGRLGDLASCAADFRDQYYGIVDHVREVDPAAVPPDHAPLVTSGLLDAAVCHWGTRPVRFARRTWTAPAVDLTTLGAADPKLAAWAKRRRVPKILLATQGRVLEAAADAEGTWLPSVPVISVVPHDSERIWHVLAVLLAPPITAMAAARYAGTALTPGSLKLSARQVADLPLPAHRERWDAAAEAVRRWHFAPSGDDRHTPLDVTEAARRGCEAYGLERSEAAAVTRWWLDRVTPRT
ncbi:HsdM family class I SAM-dependent methyltransferase [Nocardioides acrostichi]|uniref:site-specific DNA-methyltransferase (adenine-specific) n=1 Tax=Nocardioides acrostichi TaxID=2784339 RepID=A0A930YCG4_9ACTN|nr:N-6 DNA methylase [Nocardioides acrostichi]MBF4163463.1 N-6 DNA methylase [Nocardioides acrostichi]